MGRLFYVGCYAEADEPGVFACELNEKTGGMRVLTEVSGVKNPTYVAKHPFLPVLYSVGSDEAGGVAAALSIAEDGSLTLRSTTPVGGNGGCHVAVNRTGDYIAMSDYGSAALTILRLGEEGFPLEVTDHVHHTGHSVHPLRQTEAHVHFSVFEGDDLLCCDLGEDKIYRYHLDRTTGKITEAGMAAAAIPAEAPGSDAKTAAGGVTCDAEYHAEPGDGPRHLVLNSEEGRIYTVMEMGANVTTFDEQSGEILQRIPTIPADVDLKSLPLLDYDAYGAAIRSTEDGRCVLASNRGHDSITVFSVGEGGLLTLTGNAATGGVAPRDFGIAGEWVIAAHQVTSDLTALRFNEDKTGVTLTDSRLVLPSKPVCVLFV